MTKALQGKVALITGGVKRVGATIARQLHAEGMKLALHYRHSEQEAHDIQAELNKQRPDSVILLQADLGHVAKLNSMVNQVIESFGQLDALVNNASSFYPTPVGKIEEHDWDELMASNLKAPLFLSQAAAPHLTKSEGCIVNLADIHADRPLKKYPVYCCAKAGLVMLTKSLGRDLGPHVRVNAVAPGAILWPENDDMDEVTKQRIISQIALKRHGSPEDIAKTVLFLIRDAKYITGQVIPVDGGRTLGQ
ncbi:pteridine reductase [Candidatus Albibeggiatoa sp. nov. NOAA]|uniref:pteridine reductase n=1 Tax=Candidatus Albibeggiatoa sp. nov. NOAA TaxID=3162724 RepID=UPI003300760A|nr:pteridine reductase [Thiotrichaceae bacterium]